MLLLLIFFFIFSKPSYAIDDFSVVEQIKYQFGQDSACQVEEKITITNNFSQIYLKEYKINLGQKNISNLKAYDNSGNILQNINQQSDKTVISLKFNQPQVGKNKQTIFNVDYHIDKCSLKKGKTWEISLPKFIKNNSSHQIEITILIPTNYGDLSSSSIKQYTYHLQTNYHQYSFYLQDSSSPAIFIFGDHQLFDFTLNYYLENTNEYPINTQIALPPDTDYQTVRYSQINPPPTKITADNDGNWLATYRLDANSQLSITATGQARITPPKHEPTDINPTDYLSSKKYWPSNSDQINSLSLNLNSPKSIYQFVVNYLSYDYTKLNSAKREGADYALTNPQNSLCTEFTDLFVTIARNKKIPAREIEGFAYSLDEKIKPTNSGSDVLHAWPQYYDSSKKIWISVDPTWEKTTNGIDYFSDLDLNHFTFVIHGLQSDYPSPPGSYKNNQKIKTVDISFSQNEIINQMLPPTITLVNHNFVVRNPNLESLHQVKVDGKTFFMPPLSEYKLTQIMPFYQLSQTFTISADEISTTSITINNPYLKILPTIGIGLSIIILSILGIIISRFKHEKTS